MSQSARSLQSGTISVSPSPPHAVPNALELRQQLSTSLPAPVRRSEPQDEETKPQSTTLRPRTPSPPKVTPRVSHKLKSTLPAPISPTQTVIVCDGQRLSLSPKLNPRNLNMELSPTPRPQTTMRSVSVKIKSTKSRRGIISPKRTSGHHPSASMNTHAPLNHWAVR